MSLWGNTDANVSRPKWLDIGQIRAIRITNAGTGYTGTPTVTIAAPASGTQATATISASPSAGKISHGEITFTNPGDGYVSGDAAGVTFSAPAALTFDSTDTDVVSAADDTITLTAPQYAALETGDAVTYSDGGGTQIPGLVDTTVYYVIKTETANVIQLAEDAADAAAGTAIDITDVGVGASHSLTGVTATGTVVKAPVVYSASDIYFVSEEEALLEENKSRGLNGPGWWEYKTYVDHNGNTRHKVDFLVELSVPDATSGDAADDAVVADVASAVTIDTQPQSSTSSTEAGTFTVATSTTGTPGTLLYKWQRQTATATVRWVDITASLDAGITYADFDSDTLAYSGYGDDSLDGYKYRVVITSEGGTEEVISDGAATLTYGD